MQKIKLFTDSCLDPYNKMGFGVYLILNDENESLEELKENIKSKRFENTSSTKLELQTLLWALDEIADKNVIIEVYTDCQNIIGLENRRDKLEKNHFYSTSGKLMNNHDLYKDFYLKLDELSLSFIKVNERNTLIKLSDYNHERNYERTKLSNYVSEELSEVFDIKIFGEAGAKNLMNMFLTTEGFIKDGHLRLQGMNTLDIIRENYNKILLWESLE
jgi:ribonuclease HI